MSVLYLQKMFSTYSWMGLYEQRKKFRMSALQEGDDVNYILQLCLTSSTLNLR